MFDKHIVEFNENILSLRDFVDLIEPILIKKSEEDDLKVKPLILKAMLQDFVKKGTTKLTDEELKDLHEKLDEMIQGIHGENLDVEFEADTPDGSHKILKIEAQ